MSPVGADKRDADSCQAVADPVGCIRKRDANALLDQPPPEAGAVAVNPSRREAEAEAEAQAVVSGYQDKRDAEPCRTGDPGDSVVGVGAVGTGGYCNRKRDADALSTAPDPVGNGNKRDAEAFQTGPGGAVVGAVVGAVGIVAPVGRREAEAEAEAQINGNQDKRDADPCQNGPGVVGCWRKRDADALLSGSDPVGNPDRSPSEKRYAVPFQAVSFPVGVSKRDSLAQVGADPDKRDAQAVGVNPNANRK